MVNPEAEALGEQEINDNVFLTSLMPGMSMP
jgi:hypothetical protein